MSDQVPATLHAYFRAVNERRFDDLVALFVEDARLLPVGSPPVEGIDAIATYYPRILSGFTSGVDDAHTFHVADTAVTVEISFRGTTTRGADVAFDAIDVFKLDDDDKIRSLSLWYDTLDVATQVTGRTPFGQD